MEYREEQLRAAVMRAILRVISEEEIERPKGRTLYMVCEPDWDERYTAFLRRAGKTYRVSAIVQDGWLCNGLAERLREEPACERVIPEGRLGGENPAGSLTVFPVVPRELAVKSALLLSDTYDTRWVSRCMEQGSEILFLLSGLQKLSGREPAAYVGQLLSYYRKLLEYGIRIGEELSSQGRSALSAAGGAGNAGNTAWSKPADTGSGSDSERGALRDGSGGYPGGQACGRERQKQVITAADIDRYRQIGRILLYPGDIVTDMARERARFLQVTICKAEDGTQGR